MEINNLLLDIDEQELDYAFEFVQVMLGGISVDIDIERDEYKVLLRRALRIYLSELNNFQLRNSFADIQGMQSDTDFTLRFVYDNQMMSKRISDWFASLARAGGDIPIKKDYVEIQHGKQIYDLSQDSSKPFKSGSRMYHRIMWHARPEVNPNHTQPLYNGNIFSFGQAGMNNAAGYNMRFLGNAFDVMLMAASIEQRKRILQSEYFYNISGDILELTPRPDTAPNHRAGDKIFYYYFDKADLHKISKEDEKLIVNPYQVKIQEIKWSEVNSMAKNWIEEYATALAKYMQGSKWRKIRKIASPNSDYDIDLDYSGLIDEGKAEMEALKENLREELTKIDKKQLIEDKASMVDNASRVNNKSPRKFRIGE